MPDPYTVLGIAPDAADDAVRRRYLELAREFPPEQHPARFAAVRAAYEKVKDLDARARHRLSEAGKDDTIEALIEEAGCRTTRRRVTLQALLAATVPPPLTPAAVDAVLADFRAWLTDLTAAPPAPPAPPAETVDLFTLVGQFTALRHEVNLQTKAVRAATEQSAEVLRHLAAAQESQEPDEPADGAEDDIYEEDDAADDERVRPLVKAVIDVADALALSLRQMDKLRASAAALAADAEAPAAAPVPEPARPGSSPGCSGRSRRWHRGHPPPGALPPVADKLRQFAAAAADGYALSLRRVERALPLFEVEPVPAVGEPFDPELMEVVEVVAAPDRPAGTVVEEVRPGYRRRGRLLRYAQVKVAR